MIHPSSNHTYARILLSDWTLLANYIRTDAKRFKADATDTNDTNTTLSPNTINAVLEGPYATFYLPLLRVYSILYRHKMAIAMADNEVFKNQPLDPAIADALPTLSDKKINLAELEGFQKKLDDITKAYRENWAAQLKGWQALLLQTLEKSGLKLAELEITQFKAPEPIQAIREQLTDFKLTEPKYKGEYVSFKHFLTLKSMLIILSALSRQHQAHDEKAISAQLKKLNADFSAIEKQEKSLIQSLEETLKAEFSKLK